MSDRPAKFEVKLRLPEVFRAKLEAAAEVRGSSLNAEAIRRLQLSLEAEDLEQPQLNIAIRLRDLLWDRLGAEARKNGYPVETEVIRRLEASVSDDDIGRTVFRGEARFALLATLDRLILNIENMTGKDLADHDTRVRVADTVSSFFKHGPELIAALLGKPPSPAVARSVADGYALMTVAQMQMVFGDAERRTEPAEDDYFMPGGAKPSTEAA